MSTEFSILKMIFFNDDVMAFFVRSKVIIIFVSYLKAT